MGSKPHQKNTGSSAISSDDESQDRLSLLWQVLVFQGKLVLDGLRDVLLVPVSLIAATIGFFFGGDRPGQYFERVLEFGRDTESWINLFGGRDRTGTSDELLDPIRDKVLNSAQENELIREANSRLNARLNPASSGQSLEEKDTPLR